MSANTLQLLDLWDLTPPSLPPRSRLFSLSPIGIGTPAVESLTGYVTRLAAAHGVVTRRLVESEILPRLGRSYLLRLTVTGDSSSIWKDGETRALNGLGALARDLARAVGTLTLRDDLQWLTLRPWAEVIPVKGLLRRHRAWCPACYEAWRQSGSVLYEPLLWALAPVTACPQHQRALQLACPYTDCGRSLPLLGRRSSPGACSACGRYLGRRAEDQVGSASTLSDEAFRAQLWVSTALGELLAGAPGLSAAPTRARLARVIALAVEKIAGGNLTRFARDVGISPGVVAQWRMGTTLPSLALVLQVCYRLGTTPWRLLTDDLDCVTGAEALPRSDVHLLDAPHRPLPVHRGFNAPAIRQALVAVLACEDQPPPPMRQVAKRLGYSHPDMIKHFPELCHAISARYLADRHRKGVEKQQHLCAEIRQAAAQLHHQGTYPSTYRIASLISRPGFMRDRVAIAVHKEVLRELGWRP
jgi:transcriptional regulator with XRE-family HTH domain